jgi:hypothetical protein
MPAISVRIVLLDSSIRIIPLESHPAVQTVIYPTPALDTSTAITLASGALPVQMCDIIATTLLLGFKPFRLRPRLLSHAIIVHRSA